MKSTFLGSVTAAFLVVLVLAASPVVAADYLKTVTEMEPFTMQGQTQPGRTDTAEQFAKARHEQRAGRSIEEIDKGAAHVDGEQEHQIHDAEKQRDTAPFSKHEAVDAVTQGAGHLAAAA